MKITILFPDYVQTVVRVLIKEGYQCHLVGGALRDIVRGVEPKDYDLATDAKPEEVLKFFPRAISTGAKFGQITVLIADHHGETYQVEVTTFRSEASYVDGRWPSKVEFITDLDRDLGRRDFTFNAMAVDLSKASLEGEEMPMEHEVYDPYGGLKDLEDKIVRAVGTPLERFSEDGLRAYKACRMASELGFEVDADTLGGIKKTLFVAKKVSMERVRDEFVKMLMNSPKPSVGLNLMKEAGLLKLFLPELLEGVGVEQKINHEYDVYEHSLRTLDIAPDNIKIAALLHDIGKPRTDMGDGHFYGHDKVGAEMAQEIMRRLRFKNSEIERVALLVKNHMFYFPHLKEGVDTEIVKEITIQEWTDSAVRRFIARVGEENVDDLFELRIADATCNPYSSFNPKETNELQMRISEVRVQEMALKISDLNITGDDLIEMGVSKGPKVGEVLDTLLELVLDDPLVNNEKRLREEAQKLL